MAEPIVSLSVIRRHAKDCAASGQCPSAACLWPPDSAAGQAFHEHFHAQQTLKLSPRLVDRIQAARWRLQKNHASEPATQLNKAVHG